MNSPDRPLNICLASPEFAPLAKTGGLADVSAALSLYLDSAGHDIRVLIPRYRRIDELGLDIEPVRGMASIHANFGGVEGHYGIDRTVLPGSALPV